MLVGLIPIISRKARKKLDIFIKDKGQKLPH